MPAELPFVATPVGDETAARRLAERVTAALDLPAPVLIRCAMNASYAAGDVVVRVGRPTAPAGAAYDLADALRDLGIAVPAPAAGRPVESDGELVATAWERVAAGGPADWRRVGEMVGRLHRARPSVVAGDYPTPSPASLPWWHFDGLLEQARPLVDDAAYAGLADAAARHRDWMERAADPDSFVLCHGDVHPANVVFSPGGPVLLDWDLLTLAPPAWDHAPLRAMVARWGVDPAAYREFAAVAADDLGDGSVADSVTTLRAVAATLMRVLAEGPDRGDDSEAERRLRFWRGDPNAPTWRMV